MRYVSSHFSERVRREEVRKLVAGPFLVLIAAVIIVPLPNGVKGRHFRLLCEPKRNDKKTVGILTAPDDILRD